MAKRALLVGINNYPRSPLSGCNNDIRLMYQVIKEIYGFETIRVLTDEEATQNNIVKWLNWLPRGVQVGDHLLFHYSGHGSQVSVMDRSLTEEADGLDEILCPIDLDWDNPLRDHFVGNIFRLVPKGVKITVILDACHSGNGLRNGMYSNDGHPIYNRYLPPPVSSIIKDKDIDIDLDSLSYIRKTKSRDGSRSEKQRPFLIDTVEQGDAVLISGCQENQTSADAYIPELKRYHGALTFNLVSTLKDSEWKMNYSKLIKEVNKRLDNQQYTQNPQLEGKKKFWNDLFLGGV